MSFFWPSTEEPLPHANAGLRLQNAQQTLSVYMKGGCLKYYFPFYFHLQHTTQDGVELYEGSNETKKQTNNQDEERVLDLITIFINVDPKPINCSTGSLFLRTITVQSDLNISREMREDNLFACVPFC